MLSNSHRKLLGSFGRVTQHASLRVESGASGSWIEQRSLQRDGGTSRNKTRDYRGFRKTLSNVSDRLVALGAA